MDLAASTASDGDTLSDIENVTGSGLADTLTGDAAANILSYEFMRETGRAMTSLPPSVFSLGAGVVVDIGKVNEFKIPCNVGIRGIVKPVWELIR